MVEPVFVDFSSIGNKIIIIMFIIRFWMRHKQMNNGLFFLLGERSFFFCSFEWKVGFKATTQKSETYWFFWKEGKNGFGIQEEIGDLINLFKMCNVHSRYSLKREYPAARIIVALQLGIIMWRNQKTVPTHRRHTILKHIIYECYRWRCERVCVFI